MLTWLADALRSTGVAVIETPGWQTRGLGEMGDVKGVLCHHTGGSLTGDHPSLPLIIEGRLPPDPHPLQGPLSHCFLSRGGVWYVVAAGLCNHAGKGSWQGIASGNHDFIGVEAENAGTGLDHWPLPQIQSYEKGCAGLLKHIGADDVMCAGHKEYALPKGRKIDPSFDMVVFRQGVANYMKGSGLATPTWVASTDVKRDMLRKGDMGDSVKILQRALRIPDDGNFGPKTEAAVRDFQHLNGLKVDGLVGPETWGKLGVK